MIKIDIADEIEVLVNLYYELGHSILIDPETRTVQFKRPAMAKQMHVFRLFRSQYTQEVIMELCDTAFSYGVLMLTNGEDVKQIVTDRLQKLRERLYKAIKVNKEEIN